MLWLIFMFFSETELFQKPEHYQNETQNDKILQFRMMSSTR